MIGRVETSFALLVEPAVLARAWYLSRLRNRAINGYTPRHLAEKILTSKSARPRQTGWAAWRAASRSPAISWGLSWMPGPGMRCGSEAAARYPHLAVEPERSCQARRACQVCAERGGKRSLALADQRVVLVLAERGRIRLDTEPRKWVAEAIDRTPAAAATVLRRVGAACVPKARYLAIFLGVKDSEDEYVGVQSARNGARTLRSRHVERRAGRTRADEGPRRGCDGIRFAPATS